MLVIVWMVLITLTRIDIEIDKQLDNMKGSAVWVWDIERCTSSRSSTLAIGTEH